MVEEIESKKKFSVRVFLKFNLSKKKKKVIRNSCFKKY